MPSSLSAKQLQAAGIVLANSTTLFPAHHSSGDAGLPMLVVENKLGRAVIALQGAHLMSFAPTGQREMFWVSPKTVLESGKPIRGGIPLCLPWFGPGPDGKSMHGFARTMEWTLTSAARLPSGESHLVMTLAGDASTCDLWPHAFAFRLDVLVGSALKLGMTVENRGTQPAPVAFAFHTYFAVPDVARIAIGGLEQTTFIDKMDNFTRKTQQGKVGIDAVTDRIYLDVSAQQVVSSAAGNIRIESDAKCAVVWNAWSNDKNIPDMGEGNHVGYVCVERGDVADRAITLAPGASYRTWMILANS